MSVPRVLVADDQTDILQALRAMGIRCECLGKEGCLPVRVHGAVPTTRAWRIHAGVSSQFTSSLLLLAAQQPGTEPVTIQLEGNQVSRPYVEMTRALMGACGLSAERVREDTLEVRPARPGTDRIAVEVDASGMSYFLAAAAVTGPIAATTVVPSRSAVCSAPMISVNRLTADGLANVTASMTPSSSIR